MKLSSDNMLKNPVALFNELNRRRGKDRVWVLKGLFCDGDRGCVGLREACEPSQSDDKSPAAGIYDETVTKRTTGDHRESETVNLSE